MPGPRSIDADVDARLAVVDDLAGATRAPARRAARGARRWRRGWRAPAPAARRRRGRRAASPGTSSSTAPRGAPTLASGGRATSSTPVGRSSTCSADACSRLMSSRLPTMAGEPVGLLLDRRLELVDRLRRPVDVALAQAGDRRLDRRQRRPQVVGDGLQQRRPQACWPRRDPRPAPASRCRRSCSAAAATWAAKALSTRWSSADSVPPARASSMPLSEVAADVGVVRAGSAAPARTARARSSRRRRGGAARRRGTRTSRAAARACRRPIPARPARRRATPAPRPRPAAAPRACGCGRRGRRARRRSRRRRRRRRGRAGSPPRRSSARRTAG